MEDQEKAARNAARITRALADLGQGQIDAVRANLLLALSDLTGRPVEEIEADLRHQAATI